MASLATNNTTNSPSMGNTNQVTKEEVDDLLVDIHTQRGTICPISQTVFKDPVNTADGQTYERENIQRWFDDGKDTSPSTQTRLTNLTLTANVEKKAQVDAVEALRPLVKTLLEGHKKLSKLENFLEAKEKKEKEADEKERKAKEEAEERERKAKEERESKAKIEEEKRQIALRQKYEYDLQKYEYDLQAYERSLGLA